MGRGKEISEEKKKLIIRAIHEKIPYSRISQLYDVSKSGIGHLYKRFLQRKTIENKPRSGRPKVTTERQDRLLLKMCREDPRKTGPELNQILTKYHGL